jgi:single-strand DNA-binding protein
MVGEIQITVVGNITDDPELRFTPSGAAVANFTVASTARKFNKDTNEWDDKDPVFLRCSVWRQEAENVAESLQRGMRVMVTGALECRPYETREGEKRYSWEMQVHEVGASLKWATAKITKTSRQGSGPADSGQEPKAAADDPWGAPGVTGGAGAPDPWATPASGADSEPPF